MKVDSTLKSFTQLQTWQEGHRLVLMIYQKTKLFPKDEQFGLSSQLRRAAVSHTSNIAEGFTRHSIKEKRQFYRIGISSITEIQNQILVARDVDYLTQAEFEKLATQTIVVAKLTNALIRSLSPQPPATNPQPLSERGSIFLEIILTLGLITTAGLGLMLAILFAIKLEIRARWQTLAAELGRQEIEIIRHRPFESLPIQTNGPLLGNPHPLTTALPSGNAVVTIQNSAGSPTLREVTVVVSYIESGITRHLTISTLVTSGGISG